jgi:hypothetical protein
MGKIALSASGGILGMVIAGNFAVEGVPIAIQWAARIIGLIGTLAAMRLLYFYGSTTVDDETKES